MAGKAVATARKMTDGRPRHAPLRASLRNATEQDAELKTLAHSVEAEDGHQAFELLQAIAESAPPYVVVATDRGQSNARFRLRNTEAEREASAHADEALLRAAARCEAGLQISRQLELGSMEAYLV